MSWPGLTRLDPAIQPEKLNMDHLSLDARVKATAVRFDFAGQSAWH
jgi:hypothetical protein